MRQNSSDTVTRVQEMVGATAEPFSLGKGPTTVSFKLHKPTGPAILRDDGTPRRVILRVENITSSIPAPSFEVYLNLPEGADPSTHPELLAGTMSTFGLMESSKANEQHPGNGLTYVQEITPVFLRLALMRNWDGATLRVTFVPILWDYALDVKVARISIMME